MPPSSLTHTLRRLWALDKFAYSLRVFIALAGALLLCWWQGRIELLIPLFLGIIASALAETDDNCGTRCSPTSRCSRVFPACISSWANT